MNNNKDKSKNCLSVNKINLSIVELSESREKQSFSKFFQMKQEKDVLSLPYNDLIIVANIAVVKPQKAEQLENIILSVKLKSENIFSFRTLREACFKARYLSSR
jgi:hypothetical protein